MVFSSFEGKNMEFDDILHWEEICSNKSNASSALCTVTTEGNGEWSFPTLNCSGW